MKYQGYHGLLTLSNHCTPNQSPRFLLYYNCVKINLFFLQPSVTTLQYFVTSGGSIARFKRISEIDIGADTTYLRYKFDGFHTKVDSCARFTHTAVAAGR